MRTIQGDTLISVNSRLFGCILLTHHDGREHGD
jgi:hypothetical protein